MLREDKNHQECFQALCPPNTGAVSAQLIPILFHVDWSSTRYSLACVSTILLDEETTTMIGQSAGGGVRFISVGMQQNVLTF